jgi:restriction endonuclease S subunit
MKDMIAGRVRNSGWGSVSLNEGDRARYLLCRGDILLNRTNSPDLVGKVAVWDRTEEAVFPSYIVRFKLDKRQACPAYVNLILNTADGQSRLRQISTRGVSQANINPTTFQSAYLITLPPLPDQRRIAAVIHAWNASIRTAEHRIDALARRKRGIAFTLFGDGHNPFAVDGSPLEDVATVTYGKGVPAADYREDGSVWVIGTQGVMARSTRAQQHGPVVIVGRKGTLNRPIYVPPDQGFAAIDTTFILRAVDAAQSRALFQYLRYIDLAKLNEASGVPSVSAETLRSLPIPQLEGQQSDILDACDIQIGFAEDAVKSLCEQKRGLMQQLLTGKLRVPDTIDALLPSAPEMVAAA